MTVGWQCNRSSDTGSEPPAHPIYTYSNQVLSQYHVMKSVVGHVQLYGLVSQTPHSHGAAGIAQSSELFSLYHSPIPSRELTLKMRILFKTGMIFLQNPMGFYSESPIKDSTESIQHRDQSQIFCKPLDSLSINRMTM